MSVYGQDWPTTSPSATGILLLLKDFSRSLELPSFSPLFSITSLKTIFDMETILSALCLLFLLQKIPFIPTKIEHRCTQFGTLFHIQQAKFWNGYKTNMLWCNSNSTWKKLIINLQKVGLRGIKVVFSTEYCLKMNGKVAILSKPLKTQSANFTTCHMEKRLCDKERHDVQ